MQKRRDERLRGEYRREPYEAQGLRRKREWSFLMNATKQMSADRNVTPQQGYET